MGKWFGAGSGQTCKNNCGGVRQPGSSFCEECLAAYPVEQDCNECGRHIQDGEKRVYAHFKVLCAKCSQKKAR
jgi:hypothetical protein